MKPRAFAAALLMAAPNLALAQQQPSPVDRAIMLSLQLQKSGAEAQDVAVQLRAAMNRIHELEKLCGDPCKAKPEPEAK